MKLGIVLATREDLGHAVALALAARRARHEVAIFAMDLGATALAEHAGAVATLLDADCDITVCSNSAVGLVHDDAVLRGSQDDHAALLATADRTVAST